MGGKHSKHSRNPGGNRGGAGGGGGGAAFPRSPTVDTADFQRKYGFIPDNFSSIQQVQEKLREVGLESSNLIVGIDFTKSNEWTGKKSFGNKCLHTVGPTTNPYETAISVVGKCLSAFDEDNLIPCFGFGDVSTHDQGVFSFYPGGRPCNGFDDALYRYRSIVPHIKLSGPTSFAPIIEAAVRIVEQSGGQYHVLLILADGQVTRPEGLPSNVLSDQERATVEAIGGASNYPLSIVLVGLGDGPWGAMQAFDDLLPHRNFDNFQFVNLTKIMASGQGSEEQKAAKFALMALMEIPFQYKACEELNIIGKIVGRIPPGNPLEPPPAVLEADARSAQAQSRQPGLPEALGAGMPESKECPVCLEYPKDTAFQCGHQTCQACANKVTECPLCKAPVSIRIKLYS